MADINNVLAQSNIQLEATALNRFGAAVAQQRMFSGIDPSEFRQYNGGLDPLSGTPPEERGWDSTRYSAAIASGDGGYDPKTKFLFKVKFLFHPAVSEMMSSLGNRSVDGGQLSQHLTFTVKQIDLPKIDFEYEEVNMYNFRTKVLKSISNRQLSMTFYDDIANHSLSFANIYMMLLMPITRMRQSPSNKLEDYGFAFSKDYQGIDTSFRGVLPGLNNNVISEMTIEQVYVERAGSSVTSRRQVVDDHVKMNSFTFINPKIIQFDISEQDHENGSAANMITTQFEFDAIRIDTGKPSSEMTTSSLSSGDMLFDAPDGPASNPSQAGGFGGQFDNFTVNQGNRAGTFRSPYDTINADSAGGGLGGSTYEMKSAYGTAAERTLRDVAIGRTQGFARPSTAFVVDSNTSIINAIKNSGRQ